MARATAIEEMVQTWEGGTRRGVLRLLAGTAAGAVLLGRLGIDDAAAKKCVAPGKKCKSRTGKKKCCGGARCQGKRCTCTGNTIPCGKGCCTPDEVCPGDTIACGKNCCKPGQVCQGDTCVNGTLEPGDLCNPDAPFACQTGNCQCISNAEITQCTCRQAVCFGFGVPCENTVQCCSGGCEGFTNTCLPIEA